MTSDEMKTLLTGKFPTIYPAQIPKGWEHGAHLYDLILELSGRLEVISLGLPVAERFQVTQLEDRAGALRLTCRTLNPPYSLAAPIRPQVEAILAEAAARSRQISEGTAGDRLAAHMARKLGKIEGPTNIERKALEKLRKPKPGQPK